jgi:hypothetical protein
MRRGSSRRVLLPGLGTDQREAARSRPGVWCLLDHIGPIDPAMPEKRERSASVLCAVSEKEWRRRDRRKPSLAMKTSPGLPAGRAEGFPVEGELCFHATPFGPRSSDGLLPPLAGVLCRLPDFRRFLQIETSIPVAARPAATAFLHSLHRRSDLRFDRHGTLLDR